MISAGHSFESIQGYTLDQVRLFARAIARREIEERRARIFDMRAAQAEQKGFERYIKALK